MADRMAKDIFYRNFRRHHRTKCDDGGMVAKATKPNRTYLLTPTYLLYILRNYNKVLGGVIVGYCRILSYSSAGRALEWHSSGQRFDPAYLHQLTHEAKASWVKFFVKKTEDSDTCTKGPRRTLL